MAKKRNIEGERLHTFELSDGNRTVRWILIAILVLVGVAALVIGLTGALRTPAGWQTVEPSSTNLNNAQAFVFQYDLGAGDVSATKESKALSLLYGQLSDNAWRLFYNEAGDSEQKGIYYLNHHLNEEVAIDPALYKALQLAEDSGTRALYLGPVYAAYDQVLYSENAMIAADRDPGQNQEVADYIAQIVAFANDPEAISLEIRSDCRVFVQVSAEYMAFARENELDNLLDFGWMKNAAAIDYLADSLHEAGFTNGYLTSKDGFIRNLDKRGNSYSLNIFGNNQNGGELAALMDYTGPVAMVMLRSFPMYREDTDSFYLFENGRIVTNKIDPADGVSKAAADTLVSYKTDGSCLEVALSVMPCYVTDTFAAEKVDALMSSGIYSFWILGKEMAYNQKELSVEKQNDTYAMLRPYPHQ